MDSYKLITEREKSQMENKLRGTQSEGNPVTGDTGGDSGMAAPPNNPEGVPVPSGDEGMAQGLLGGGENSIQDVNGADGIGNPRSIGQNLRHEYGVGNQVV